MKTPLTKREREVMQAMVIANGDFLDAAEMLGITRATIKTHLDNIYHKTHTHGLVASILHCLRAGEVLL